MVFNCISASEPRAQLKISQLTGLSEKTVRGAIQSLRLTGLIYVCDSVVSSTKTKAMHRYLLGFGKDSPETVTKADVKIFRHPLDIALYGEYQKAA